MKKYDIFWMSDKSWYHQKPNGMPEVNDDAPPEAQESYKHYLQQRAEEREYLKAHPGYF